MPTDRVSKTRPMLRVEQRIGRPLEEYLAEAYQTRTQLQIAEALTVDVSTVNRWMRQLDIEARFPGQKPPVEAIA